MGPQKDGSELSSGLPPPLPSHMLGLAVRPAGMTLSRVTYYSHLLLKLSKCFTGCSQHNFSSCRTCWDYRF